MLSKEEVSDVILYCKEHGCTYKDRLGELGIPEWKFYDSKYKYALQERGDRARGQFLQLKSGADGSLTPFPSFDSPQDRPQGRQVKPVSIIARYAEHRTSDSHGHHDAHPG